MSPENEILSFLRNNPHRLHQLHEVNDIEDSADIVFKLAHQGHIDIYLVRLSKDEPQSLYFTLPIGDNDE
jgi:hypothetical protein